MRTMFRLLACAAAWATCARGQEAASAAGNAGPTAVVVNYALQAGDVIRVQVFQEDDLDRELSVSQDGTIVLPLIGAVTVGGRTVREIEADIARRLDADYIVNPQINVSVLRYAERHVNIMGQVARQGPVVLPAEERMTLLDAITRAGGFSIFGDRRRVRLTRMGPDGQAQVHTIDTDQILQGRAEDPWLLEPNDNIYVPERRF